MANFIYCGTNPPVDAAGTQQLLAGSFNAIWCPPPRTKPFPVQGDRLWLVFRDSAVGQFLVLGGGRVQIPNGRRLLWSEKTCAGIVAASVACGYPHLPLPKARFLKLGPIQLSHGMPVITPPGSIRSGLYQVSALQVATLTALLPIP